MEGITTFALLTALLFTRIQSNADCVDDITVNCYMMDALFRVCNGSKEHAALVCPKTCNLCNYVNGKWLDWEKWSACTGTCGITAQTRTRMCAKPFLSKNRNDCEGSSEEYKSCMLEPCPVPVGWGTWGEWGSCSSTCGVGIQNRNRSCVEPLSSSDDDFCNGETTDYQLCMPRACTDGGWASWGSWSSCTATCGGGTSKRYRECTNPTPSPYGQQCYGPNVDFDVCSIFPCESQGAVAFYAVLANKALNLRKGQTVVFDRVLTNIASTQSGGSYNATTGVFTAPLSGVYVFSCSIMAYDTSFTHVALHKNNIPLSTMYVNGRSGHNFDSAASTVTVSLTKGDRVYAKHIDNDQGLEGIYYAGQSTFTGFLVQRQHDDAPVVGLK